MMLQGNLQNVFDALYHLGVIEPVLELDWLEEMKQIGRFDRHLERAIEVANQHQADAEILVNELKKFDSKTLSFLAMEVAREYAEFHARNLLH